MKDETKFKVKILARLKEIPGLWYTKVQMVSVRGVPDILICYKGQFIAMELKTDSGKLDPLQGHVLKNIAKAGGTAIVVTPHNVKDVFREVLWQDY